VTPVQGIIDLTLPLGDAIRYRRSLPTTVLMSRRTQDRTQILSEIVFSPHALTHIDLPWALAWGNYPNKPKSNDQTLVEKYRIPRVQDAVIVDISSFAELIYDHMRDIQHYDFPRIPTSDFWRNPVDNSLSPLVKVLRGLRVTANYLKTKLQQIPLENRIVLFRTGWRRFAPPDHDISHPQWLLWHPHTLTPYLDAEAAQYLLKRGVTCIGSDTHSLDTPLRQQYDPAGTAEIPIQFSFAKEIFNKKLYGDLDPWPDFRKCPLKYRPVHTLFLSRNFPVLEHLRIPLSVFKYWSAVRPDVEQQDIIQGRIGIFPIPNADEREALLISVLFHPHTTTERNA
jgi:kynurenine formamidase